MDSPSTRTQPATRRWWKILPAAVAGPSWCAVIFVWGSWALLFVAALANVKQNGNRFPYWDDWGLLPWAVGTKPITISFLWAQDSEHREPFLRALYFSAIKLSRGDYRAYPFFTCLVAGGLALALIRAARTQRGWTSCPDAFFSLVLLQPAFREFCILDAWGVAMYTLPALVASGLLVIIVQKGVQLTLGTGILAAIGLMLLPLCNAGGLVFLVPLGSWFGYVGIRSWRLRHTEGLWTSFVILGGVFIAFVTLILYFVGYQRSNCAPPVSSMWNWLETSLSIATSSLGAIFAEMYWPYSGLALLIFLGISENVLMLALCRKHGKTRGQAAGLLFFLGASCMLALALGWGRGGFGSLNFGYTVLAVPILLGLYFVWGLAMPGAVRFLGQACLFVALCFAAAVNIPASLSESRERRAAAKSIETDLRNGVPPTSCSLATPDTL